MTFNYFRILVTLLASFGAFFAYICRLNLRWVLLSLQKCDDCNPSYSINLNDEFNSFTIDEMVIKADCLPVSDQCNGTGRIGPDFPSSALINTEEQTLAWLSKSYSRRWATSGKLKVPERSIGRRGLTRTSRLTKSSIYGLSIVFDIEQNATGMLPDQQVPTTTVPSESKSNQPALDTTTTTTTREEAYLLDWSEVSRFQESWESY